MTHVRMSDHFEAPIERVFDLALDFMRYPEWNVNYVEVKEITGPTDRLGTRIHATLKMAGRLLDSWTEIKEIERPTHIRVEGLASGSLDYRFTPDETGTKAAFEFDYELSPGIVTQIADRLFIERSVERDLRHSLDNWKAFLAANAPVLA